MVLRIELRKKNPSGLAAIERQQSEEVAILLREAGCHWKIVRPSAVTIHRIKWVDPEYVVGLISSFVSSFKVEVHSYMIVPVRNLRDGEASPEIEKQASCH